MSLATTSTPAMSRPTTCAASTARAATSGWTRSVTSIAVPPVLRLPLRRMSTTRAGRRDRLGREALVGQHGQGDRVELDLAQHRGVMLAAARILVDDVDQFADGVRRRRRPPGPARGGRPPPRVRPRPAGGSRAPGRTSRPSPPCSPAGRPRRPCSTCSRVVRLVATPRPWLPSRGLTTTGTPISSAAAQASSASVTGRPSGTGTPTDAQQHAGQFLVLGDLLGDGAGAIGLGRLDAPLPGAVAELHQAVGVQPPHGNAAGHAPPRRSRWCSAPGRLRGPGRAAARSRPSRRTADRGSPPGPARGPWPRRPGPASLPCTRRPRGRRPLPTSRGRGRNPRSTAGQRLQFQGDVLEDVAR